jgi:cysteine synthase
MANDSRNRKPVQTILGAVQKLTTAANGAYTAQIDDFNEFARLFVQLTSGGATEYAVLPKAHEETIGREIYITVGSNGYELVTPSGSGDTINGVDADGTNQLDVAASTTVRLTQVSATGWLAETIAASSIAVTAPDND